MKKLSIIIILPLVITSTTTFSQSFSVPDSILKEMKDRKIKFKNNQYHYKIILPANYDSTAKYPVLLALSGGDQSEQIVNYCYYTLFKSKYFKHYITILPIGTKSTSLDQLDSIKVNELLSVLANNENVSKSHWIVAGTSFGGIAAFNFANSNPKLFDGIIVSPGAPLNVFPAGPPINVFPDAPKLKTIPAAWKKYKIVLAIGEKDDEIWIDATNKTEQLLKGKVKQLRKFIMKGQGHIISPEYNRDLIFQQYFK